jgi:hypothetical protein
MRTAASFNADRTRFQLRNRPHQLRAPRLSAQNYLSRQVHAMQLKHVLCQVDT